VQLVERTGAVSTLEEVRPAGTGGAAASTLDAGIQTQAQAALASAAGLSSAVVVLQAGTGNILAMASNPPNGRLATHADRPPGSAFKIVVASALLAAGDSPDTAAPCDASYTIPNGRTFKNNKPGDTNPGANLAFDFAVSCNTAFVARGMKVLAPSQRLFDHAAQVYGLTGEWDIGLGSPTAYWDLPNPGANRDLWGEDLLGQGGISVEPLAMASVAATASTGTFRQPVIIPGYKPSVTTRVRAPSDGLRRMMRQTVNSGTASALQGLGDVGAKTGTADVTGGNVNWMVAYRGDIAVACLVQGLDGSGGNATAGPIVARLLKSI
jgi:cell division protein FtsI/penicillin-binding protein 2